jgi:hypothetical protein
VGLHLAILPLQYLGAVLADEVAILALQREQLMFLIVLRFLSPKLLERCNLDLLF